MINNQLRTTKNIFVRWITDLYRFVDEWSVLDTAIMWVETSRKQVTIRLCIAFFRRKTSFKSILNWMKVFRCKLVFTKMVLDSRLQLCDPWNTTLLQKVKQEHFWIILWRSLDLLKGNTSQKTIPVTWQYSHVYNEC